MNILCLWKKGVGMYHENTLKKINTNTIVGTSCLTQTILLRNTYSNATIISILSKIVFP